MLYLDSPAGVGFSFSNSTEDYVTDDTKTAEDTNRFLRLFLGQRHPELANNRFFVAGESYAGIYVPTLMRRIVEGNAAGELPKIAAEGYMVGNGCTDPVFDGNALIPYVHGKSLISDAQYSSVKKACGGSYWNASDGSQCGIGLSKIDEILGGLNIYDTLDRCYRGGDEKETRLSEELPKMTVGRAWPAMAAVKPGRVATWPELTRKLRGAPPCIDDRAAFALLNSPSVRKAIHASPLAGEWNLCTDKLTYTHDIPTMIPIHEGLLKEGFRALIYSGDHDMCVPHTGSEAWTRSLGEFARDTVLEASHQSEMRFDLI
jgi:serine carboxypeptidase-like clade 1